jgi:hypothetical protein
MNTTEITIESILAKVPEDRKEAFTKSGVGVFFWVNV